MSIMNQMSHTKSNHRNKQQVLDFGYMCNIVHHTITLILEMLLIDFLHYCTTYCSKDESAELVVLTKVVEHL